MLFDFNRVINGKIRTKYLRWAIYLNRKLTGRCVMCNSLRNSYSRFCDRHYGIQSLAWSRYDNEHKERVLKKARRIREYRRANRQCIACGVPLCEDIDRGHVNCLNCREKLTYIY